MKILIVGGVAGGASAAARLRRLSEDNEITILNEATTFPMPTAGCLIMLAALSRMEKIYYYKPRKASMPAFMSKFGFAMR